MAIAGSLSSIPPLPVAVIPQRTSVSPSVAAEASASERSSRSVTDATGPAGDEPSKGATTERAPDARPAGESAQSLDEAELKELQTLKARDREVRAHEQAHQAVGGQYAGSISYTYERGPDGSQYAVGGEVSIDVSAVDGDPQATIEKMRIVQAAALAPAQPSSQDRAVAAEAMQQMLQAQMELAMERRQENASEGVGAYQSVAGLASGNSESAALLRVSA